MGLAGGDHYSTLQLDVEKGSQINNLVRSDVRFVFFIFQRFYNSHTASIFYSIDYQGEALPIISYICRR